MSKRFIGLTAVTLAAVVLGFGVFAGTGSVSANHVVAGNEMTITHSGGDPGPGGGGSVLFTPFGGPSFSIELNVTSVADAGLGLPYQGYQWEFAWLNAVISVGGGNTELQPGIFNLCAPPAAPAIIGPLEIYGGGAGCASSGLPTAFTGAVTSIDLVCAGVGVSYVSIVTLADDPVFGTTMFDPGGGARATTMENQLPNPLFPVFGPPTVAAVVVDCFNFIDVGVTKSDTVDPVAAPGTTKYGLTITNANPVTAAPVSVIDFADAGVTFSSDGSEPGACAVAPGLVSCASLIVPAGGAVAFTFDAAFVAADACTTKSNTVQVFLEPVFDPSGLPVTLDVNPLNDVDTETTDVACTAISVVKSVTPGPYVQGITPVTFTFTTCNAAGASEALGVTIIDAPNGPSSSSPVASIPAGGCDVSTIGPMFMAVVGEICDTVTADPSNGAADTDSLCITVLFPRPPIDGIAKDTTDPSGDVFEAPNPLANLWLCKSNDKGGLSTPGDKEIAGQVDCGKFTIAEVVSWVKDADTCNDDDDGNGRGCLAFFNGDQWVSGSTDWDGDFGDLDLCLDVDGDGECDIGGPGGDLPCPDEKATICLLDASEGPEGLGALEFQIKFDHKLFQHPTANCNDDLLAPDGRIVPPGGSIQDIITENWVIFGCVSKDDPTIPGTGTGSDVAGVGAWVTFTTQPDLLERIRPTKDNGARADLLDENCEIADIFGSPINAETDNNGANNVPSGGLVPDCKDAVLTIRMLEGDLNLDCVVDVQDDQIAAFRYGQAFGSLAYDPFFDVEPATFPPDWDIDIKDLQFVFGRNTSTCDDPIPNQDPQGQVPDP